MDPRELTGDELGVFADALGNAFLDPLDLTDMLVRRLNRNLADYQPAAAVYPNTRMRLVRSANADGWWQELLRAARASRPGNRALLQFEQSLRLSSGLLESVEVAEFTGAAPAGAARQGRMRTDLGALEREVKKHVPTFDAEVWTTQLGVALARVCRIEVKTDEATEFGTGFLVGPDLVLTNYHVIESAHNAEQAGKPQSITCLFDYRVRPDGTTDPGTPMGLRDEWLVAWRPISPRDSELYPKSDPAPTELDYALLRLVRDIGARPIGSNAETKAAQRGWFTPLSPPYNFASSDALFILQHPRARPLKLAIDFEAISVRPDDAVRYGLIANRTRLLYRTNTEAGSSGSPCFGPNWELVAIHHAGDPDFHLAHTPDYNQGIPIEAIVADLRSRNTPIEFVPFAG